MVAVYFMDQGKEVPLKPLGSGARIFETQSKSLLLLDGSISVDFEGRSPNEIKQLLASSGVDGETISPAPDLPFHIVKLRNDTPDEVFRVVSTLKESRKLKAQPRFTQVSRHFPAFAPKNPYKGQITPGAGEKLLPYQWGLKEIKVDQVWEQLAVFGNPDVSVAIIDTGFDLKHPDLSPNLLPGWDLEDNDDSPKYAAPPAPREEAHGTACAGIVAATGGAHGQGVFGVAPRCKIIPIRYGKLAVVDGIYFVPTNPPKLAAAIDMAVKLKASVISISASIARDNAQGSVRNAIQRAAREGRDGKGCVVVVAAGNRDDGPVELPARYEGAIAVAASQRQHRRCTPDDWGRNNGSCRGPEICVAAPGVDIWTTDIQGEEGFVHERTLQPGGSAYTTRFRGTSAACPFVAGVAALILSVNPRLTAQRVREIIEETASMPGGGGRNDELGHGIINAFNAVQEAVRSVSGGGQS